MAIPVNNYRNQVRVKTKLDQSFNSFWSKTGIAQKDSPVGAVLEQIVQILVGDLKRTVKDEAYNRSLFDRVEFKDLMQLISKILEKYSSIQQSDTEYTTDVVRNRLKQSIVDELEKFLDDCIKKSESETTEIPLDEKSKKQIYEIIQTFFDKNRPDAKSKTNEKDIVDLAFHEFRKRFSKTKDAAQKQVVEKTKIIEDNPDKTINAPSIKNSPGEQLKISKQKLDSQKSGAEKSRGIFQRLLKKSGDKTLIPQLRKTDENKELVSTTQDQLEKTNKNFFSRHMVTLTKSFNKIKSEIKKIFQGTFKILRFVFSPLAKLFKGTLNAVLHPIQTVSKLLKSNWLTKLMQFGMSNPANAFMLGAFAAIMVNFAERTIFPLIDHYIILPALRIVDKIFKTIQPILSAVFDFLSDQNGPVGLFKRIFKKNPQGDSFMSSLFLNIAEFVGVSFPAKLAKMLCNNADVILKTMGDLANHPFLMGFANTTRLSWFLKPALIATIAAGNALGKIYEVDGDSLKLSQKIKNDKIDETLKTSAKDIVEGMKQRLIQSGEYKEYEKRGDIERLSRRIFGLERELMYEQELNGILERAGERWEDGDIFHLEPDFVNKFLKSDESSGAVFDEKNLNSILETISNSKYGADFYSLYVPQQLEVLSALVMLRNENATKLYDAFNSKEIEINKRALQEKNILDGTITIKYDLEGVSDSRKTFNEKVDFVETKTLPYQFGPVSKVDELHTEGGIDFSTDQSTDDSMKILSEGGIDADSELSKFLETSGLDFEDKQMWVTQNVGQGHMASIPKKVRKFKNDEKTKLAVFKYFKTKQERSNQKTRVQQIQMEVRQSLSQVYKEETGGFASFNIPLQTEIFKANQRIEEIVESNKSDTEKMKELAELIDEISKNNEVMSRRLKSIIKRAYGETNNTAFVINNRNGAHDLEGENTDGK